MMELIRTWLIGITAAALAAALAESLAPEGAVKRIGKLAGGLLLLTAVLQPVLGLDFEAMAQSLASYRMETGEYGNALEVENERLLKTIIEEQTGAYIQDKAAQLGIQCTAAVVCKTGEDGTVYPAEVTILGQLSDDETEQLSRTIEAELAIPAECQQYERTDTG